jgi:hypothetical protein
MEGDVRRRACDVCGKEYVFGPYSYGLRRNALYDMWICSLCHHRNAEGWSPEFESRLLTNLQALDKPVPRRLPNGLLPYD